MPDDEKQQAVSVSSKTLIYALAVMLGSGGVGGAVSFVNHGPSETVVKSEMMATRASLESLKAEIKALTTAVTRMSSDGEGLRRDVDRVEQEIRDLKERVRALETKRDR